MVLLWPWSSVGFGAVAIAAIWALLRPSRRIAIVGSIELWQEAQKALADAPRRRAKRVTLAWLLLLAGAAACVAAMTRPTINASRRRRRVAIVLLPSAELGRDQGIRQMQDAARRLLGRLDARDVVRVIMPRKTGMESTGDLTANQAREDLLSLGPVPIPAARLAPVAVDKDVQHVYTFVAAGAPSAAPGPNADVVEIPHALPGATIDAVGAETTGDGKVQVFLALRNQSDSLWTGTVRCRGMDADGKEQWRWDKEQYRRVTVSMSAGQRKELVVDVPSIEILAIDAVPTGTLGWIADSTAYLVRHPLRRTKVALTGEVNNMLARFVESDPTLELADATDPDVKIVIANGPNAPDPPRDKAAVVIDPPTPPEGCKRAGEIKAADLAKATVASDDPVMRNVLLEGVQVARLVPWKFGGSPLQTVSVRYPSQGDAVVIRQRKTATGIEPRVYLAFSIAMENTAFGMTDKCVIFLANSVRHLVPGAAGKVTFDYASPVEAGPAGRWVRLLPAAAAGADDGPSPYPWPGAYRYGEGKTQEIHAVNIVGLRPAKVAVTPAAAVSALKLPKPQRDTVGNELWPALLAAAVLFWLVGWWARLR